MTVITLNGVNEASDRVGIELELEKSAQGKDSFNVVAEIWSSNATNKNRNIAAAATTYAEATNQATWAASDNVREITIASVGASTAELLDDMALVIYDALNESSTVAQFADAGGASADVEYELINLARPVHRIFKGYLSNICIVPLGGSGTRFVIQAN